MRACVHVVACLRACGQASSWLVGKLTATLSIPVVAEDIIGLGHVRDAIEGGGGSERDLPDWNFIKSEVRAREDKEVCVCECVCV